MVARPCGDIGAANVTSAPQPWRADAGTGSRTGPVAPDLEAARAGVPAEPRPPAETPPGPLAPAPSAEASGAAAALAPGTLIVAVKPWASVWVNGKAYGETPVHIKLPPGRHRVRIANQHLSRTVTVAITSARATLLERDL